jgi:hypothetical protein
MKDLGSSFLVVQLVVCLLPPSERTGKEKTELKIKIKELIGIV